MVSHAEHTTTSTQPAARILAALTAVALLVGTLLMLGVIPAGALMLLGLAYIARTTR